MNIRSCVRSVTPYWLQYRIDLKSCIDAEEQHSKTRPPNTREAHESGAIFHHAFTYFELREQNRSLVTSHYRRLAGKLLVPMPDISDARMWAPVEMEETEHSIRYLTTHGEVTMRAAIREERRHRRESAGYWFTMALGVIGALTGLVSAFK